jgi:hypothetical protein|uniref:Uncharacterized protein n=1 Tax=Zea mays TaxID=4577 RepID=C0HF11_MAIZE|nr:unknown [Zea mays]
MRRTRRWWRRRPSTTWRSSWGCSRRACRRRHGCARRARARSSSAARVADSYDAARAAVVAAAEAHSATIIHKQPLLLCLEECSEWYKVRMAQSANNIHVLLERLCFPCCWANLGGVQPLHRNHGVDKKRGEDRPGSDRDGQFGHPPPRSLRIWHGRIRHAQVLLLRPAVASSSVCTGGVAVPFAPPPWKKRRWEPRRTTSSQRLASRRRRVRCRKAASSGESRRCCLTASSSSSGWKGCSVSASAGQGGSGGTATRAVTALKTGTVAALTDPHGGGLITVERV